MCGWNNIFPTSFYFYPLLPLSDLWPLVACKTYRKRVKLIQQVFQIILFWHKGDMSLGQSTGGFRVIFLFWERLGCRVRKVCWMDHWWLTGSPSVKFRVRRCSCLPVRRKHREAPPTQVGGLLVLLLITTWVLYRSLNPSVALPTSSSPAAQWQVLGSKQILQFLWFVLHH